MHLAIALCSLFPFGAWASFADISSRTTVTSTGRRDQQSVIAVMDDDKQVLAAAGKNDAIQPRTLQASEGLSTELADVDTNALARIIVGQT